MILNITNYNATAGQILVLTIFTISSEKSHSAGFSCITGGHCLFCSSCWTQGQIISCSISEMAQISQTEAPSYQTRPEIKRLAEDGAGAALATSTGRRETRVAERGFYCPCCSFCCWWSSVCFLLLGGLLLHLLNSLETL